MQFDIMQPCVELQPYVAYIWEVKGQPVLAYEQIVPSGFVELMFNLGSELYLADPISRHKQARWTGSFINGVNSQSILLKMGQDVHLVGVRLKPEGAFALCGNPMFELSNQVVAADDLLASLSPLHEHLLHLPNYTDRKQALEKALFKLIRPYSHFSKLQAVFQSLNQSKSLSDTRLKALAEQVSLSPKSLWRHFEFYVGLPPQTMKKIIRLNQALKLIHRPEQLSFTEIAHHCSYADQSHLIRDFKQLTGLSPKKYLAFQTHNPGHLYF